MAGSFTSGPGTSNPDMLTKREAVVPLSIVAILPQGALMLGLVHVATNCPSGRAPADSRPKVRAVGARRAADDTQPLLRRHAVLRRRRGHCGNFDGNCANVVSFLVPGL